MCGKESTQTPLQVVWSDGTTTTGIFHPLTGDLPTAMLHNVRASYEIQNNSTAAKVRAALRYGDDGLSWDSAVAFGRAASTTTGWTYGTSFTDVTALGTRKLRAQLGVLVVNDSGSAVEFCRARVRLDYED